METIESLKRRISAAEDLHSLVRTMKALAAVNIRQLERAVQSLADYARTIERGLHVVLRARGRPQGHEGVSARVSPRRSAGVIVFGSDQGMCGQLNDAIADFALRHIDGLSDSWPSGPQAATQRHPLLVVGVRAAARLEDAGLLLESTLPVAGSAAGVTPLVQDILMHIERWRSAQHVDRVLVFYCEHISRASYQPRRLNLLPLDRRWMEEIRRQAWPTHVLPSFTMEADRLFSSLVRQYLFVSLYRAAAESLASENASRLAAMRGGERIADLIGQRHFALAYAL